MNLNVKEHAGATLVAAVLVGAALAQGLFDPTGYAAASVVVWAAVIAGLAGRVLPVAPVGTSARFAGLCLAGTAVLATASLAWASDQGRAFEEAVRVSFYLGLFTLAACTASRLGRREWLAGMTVGLGAVSVIAVLAYLQPGLLDSGHSDIPNAAARLSYPIGYWNGAAALLAVAAVLGAFASVAAPSRGLRSIATATIPVAGLGIWLASSRGGAVAVAAGLIVLLAASPERLRLLIRILVGAGAAGALILIGHEMHALTNGLADSAMRADGDRMSAFTLVAVAVTVGVAWFLDGARPVLRAPRSARIGIAVAVSLAVVAAIVVANPAKRWDDFKQPPSTSGGATIGDAGLNSNGRWQFWSAALDAFEAEPVRGIGAGGYEDYWARNATVPLFVRNPHSLPLQQASELGIGGILLFVGFVAAVGVAVGRRIASGLAGDTAALVAVLVAGCVGATIDWTWEIPAAFAPAVIAAALLAASAPSTARGRDSYWLGAATVAAAWLAMIAGGLVVLSELELKQSRSAAGDERIADGITRAQQAHTVQPWSAEPYTQLALLDEERGDIDGALANLQNAEQRDSEDWRLPLIEARLQARRGNGPAARMAIQRARSLSPLLPIFNSTPPSQG
jgi:hypothetical protein